MGHLKFNDCGSEGGGKCKQSCERVGVGGRLESMTFPSVGLSGERRKDMIWSGSSGLCGMLFLRSVHYGTFYICRLGGRVGAGEKVDERAGERASGRASGGRADGWNGGRADGAGGRAGR